MKKTYTISRDNLQKRHFKSGVCSTVGQMPVKFEYPSSLKKLIMRIMTAL